LFKAAIVQKERWGIQSDEVEVFEDEKMENKE
jgi:hypothetical protein